jgi:hypothetical protein
MVLRGKEGEKIQERLCYINAAKFVIPGRALPLTEEGEGRNDRFLPQIPIIQPANCLLCRCIFIFSSFSLKGIRSPVGYFFESL